MQGVEVVGSNARAPSVDAGNRSASRRANGCDGAVIMGANPSLDDGSAFAVTLVDLFGDGPGAAGSVSSYPGSAVEAGMAHFFSSSSTRPPACSMRSIMARRSSSCMSINSAVRLRTRPSERPCPSRPGTISVRRSKPSRMACRRFFSVAGSLGQRTEPSIGAAWHLQRAEIPDAMWFCFFSCSVRRGFPSATVRPPSPGDDSLLLTGAIAADVAGLLWNGIWVANRRTKAAKRVCSYNLHGQDEGNHMLKYPPSKSAPQLPQTFFFWAQLRATPPTSSWRSPCIGAAFSLRFLQPLGITRQFTWRRASSTNASSLSCQVPCSACKSLLDCQYIHPNRIPHQSSSPDTCSSNSSTSWRNITFSAMDRHCLTGSPTTLSTLPSILRTSSMPPMPCTA